MTNNRTPFSHHHGHKILAGILCLLAICGWAQTRTVEKPSVEPLRPISSAADTLRNEKGKVYLIRADEWSFDKKLGPDYQVIRGNVCFRKDSMYMYCDSAYLYESDNSLDAYGNVRMEQGDTLFIYGDKLIYNGKTQIARLRESVRMINRDVTLYTDSFNYELDPNFGYYFTGGKIINGENTLTSVFGRYSPDTKIATFRDDVLLVNERATLTSDTLHYNTETKVADIVGPTVIRSDSNTIYSTAGWYNTETDQAMLLKRSRLVGESQTLTGDTLFYDRNKGDGEAFGNMSLRDSVHHLILQGQYGFYNEKTEYAFTTDSARILEFSGTDTLYMHADTIRMERLPDSTRLVQAYHGVRFFRNDAQGVCDSVAFLSRDSLITLYDTPVLWSGTQQLTGDSIQVFLNDSTIDHAFIPSAAFAVDHKEGNYYDQLSGTEMKIYFTDGLMSRIDVSGNVRTIYYPMERDSTYTGHNWLESSFLSMYLKDQKLDKLVMWPAVSGRMTPIPELKEDVLYLPGFVWYDRVRPTDKDDIFRKPEAVQAPVLNTTKHKFKH